jgi:membrane protease YdiL (CAAX protease family)
VSFSGDEPVRSEVGQVELAAGLALAAACFAATFRGPRSSFWPRMTTTGALLGTAALRRRPELRRLRFRPRHLAEGAAIAAGLYLVFGVGDRLARRVMPAGAEDISALYDLRRGQNTWLIATRLAAVIAPAEELFWRGWLQRSLAGHRGRWRAGALAAGAYGAVHVVAGNPTLVGAASVAGAWWSALAALGVDMESLVVSHLLWDIVIFLVAPTSR